MSQYVESRIATQARDAWRRSHLARHLIEMYLAMQVGMVVGSLLLSVAVGEARQQHPVASLLVMALSMTVPMVAWSSTAVTHGEAPARWQGRCSSPHCL